MTKHDKMISGTVRQPPILEKFLEATAHGPPTDAPPLPGVCASISTEITSWNVAFARSISNLLGRWNTERTAVAVMLNCLVDGSTFKRTLGERLKCPKINLVKMSQSFSNIITRGLFMLFRIPGTKCVGDLMVIPMPPSPVPNIGPSCKSCSALRCSSACCCERWICCSSVWTLSRLGIPKQRLWLCPQRLQPSWWQFLMRIW